MSFCLKRQEGNVRDDRLLFFMLASLCCAMAAAAHSVHAAPAPAAASAGLQARVQKACDDALAPVAAAGWKVMAPPRTRMGTSAPDQPHAVICLARVRSHAGAAADIRIEANASSGGFVTLVPFRSIETQAPVTQAYRSPKAQPASDSAAGVKPGPATILFIGPWRPLAGEDGDYGCDFLFPEGAAKDGIYNYFVRFDGATASADKLIGALGWSALDAAMGARAE